MKGQQSSLAHHFSEVTVTREKISQARAGSATFRVRVRVRGNQHSNTSRVQISRALRE